jgi:5-oxoprolinase (ATP-hydrolysing)/N-methylhydantoinase A
MSVNIRTRTGWYVGPNIYAALAEAAPHRVQAFTGLPSSAQFYGVDEDRKLYSDHLFQGGGQGASAAGDGKSALLYPTSAANTSVEMFEARVPALVLRKELVNDSGGAGKFRGGLGQVVSARKLKGDKNSCQIGIFPNGIHSEVEGLFGGKSGGHSRGIIHRADDVQHDVGTGELTAIQEVTEVAELYIAGGSGYGDPLTRDYEYVQNDLIQGYISYECAERVYGCIFKEDGTIDVVASDTLRKSMKDAAS